jgi:hypothetical protein
VLIVSGACGKKGPPLPPLVKIPAAPADVTAVRRGSEVTVQFTVPTTNTDGTRPANVARVDVYAYTGLNDVPEKDLLKRATKIGSVGVKAPRDPDVTVEPDESDETEPLEGAGLDQGAVARVDESLAQTTTAAAPSPIVDGNGSSGEVAGPLLGPLPTPQVREYVAVGIAKRGRRGPLSKPVGIPLVPPPSPPSDAHVMYDENAATIAWSAPRTGPATDTQPGVLASRAVGMPGAPHLAYVVYDKETRLTRSPVSQPKFQDDHIVWGNERCYVVRTVATYGDVSIESDGTPPACVTFVDTFPPAAPKSLHAVAGEGSISLIWEPNNEKDLAGYLVLRGPASSDTLEPVTPKPIQEATYKDDVPAGRRYVYAVRAVDKAGNMSELSNRVEETAR